MDQVIYVYALPALPWWASAAIATQLALGLAGLVLAVPASSALSKSKRAMAEIEANALAIIELCRDDDVVPLVGRPLRPGNAEGACFRFAHAAGEVAITGAAFEWRHPWGRGRSRIEFRPEPGRHVTEDELRAKARELGWPGHSGRRRDYVRQGVIRLWERCRAGSGPRGG